MDFFFHFTIYLSHVAGTELREDENFLMIVDIVFRGFSSGRDDGNVSTLA